MNGKVGQQISIDDPNELIHELRVHQIELEMQNDELRRTVMELAASRERYFELYDLAPVGYLTFSDKGLILEANLTAATMLGETRSDLLKQPLSRFFLPEDLAAYFQHREKLFKTSEPQTSDLQLLTKGGAVSWIRLESTVARGIDGAAVCRAAIVDVTKSKVVERLLTKKADDLDAAMNRMAMLAGLLPLCSRCTRIKDEQGQWREFESYLRQRSASEPAKVVCTACLKLDLPTF